MTHKDKQEQDLHTPKEPAFAGEAEPVKKKKKGSLAGGYAPKSAGKTLLRLYTYLMSYKWRLLIVAILVIISALAGVAGTYLLKPILNQYIVPFISKGSGAFETLPFLKMMILMGAIYLCGALASYGYSRIMISIANSTLFNLRTDLFNSMEDLPIRYFDTHSHGEVMSRYTNDMDTVREALSQGVTSFISSIVSVAGTFVMMLVLSPVLTLLSILMLGIMLLIVRVIGKRSARYFREQQKVVGSVNGYIEEMIEGQKVIKVFSREEIIKDEFAELNEDLRKSATNANTYANVIMPIMGNLSYCSYAISAMVGALMVINGKTDIGTIGSFLQYSRSFAMPLVQISQQFNSVLAALAGAERIFEIIDEEPEFDEGYVSLVYARENSDGSLSEVPERTGVWAWKQPAEAGGFTYTKLLGDVRFKDVTFAYEKEKTVLYNLTLYAKPGQKIAFVGSTGAGKTTITNLINRFYDIEEGFITYDGIDIRQINKQDLRRSLGMVLQDTHLFTGTVKDNIRYGNLEATDDEIFAAAKLANADAFIRLLPQGYDTMLKSDGSNLSQGQRQLLSIARAAVADPPVLILDEATSSIDTRTEYLIEKGMDRLMEGRTVFVIAHRLSTVRNANAIIVLEHGEIIERGDHDELLAEKGKYYQLYTGQFELT